RRPFRNATRPIALAMRRASFVLARASFEGEKVRLGLLGALRVRLARDLVAAAERLVDRVEVGRDREVEAGVGAPEGATPLAVGADLVGLVVVAEAERELVEEVVIQRGHE